VIGGGLAGIAAAVSLAQEGLRVTLVETRKRLGGRATSFVDPTTGHVLDNCQHVLMGCCTNLIDLYRRLGVADQIHWHKRLYFADGRGVIDRLEADDLPAPMHMTRSLMAFRSFSLLEKVAIVRGMLAILRLGRAGREGLHHLTFAKWLTLQRQPRGAVDKFWSVIIVSALNELPERVDGAYAIQVFQDGFLSNERAYVMGLASVPLVRLYDTAQRVIGEKGGEVLLSAGAEGLAFDGHRVTALRLAGGRELTADVFVSALPPDRLAKLCTAQMRGADPRLGPLEQIGNSPIIGIHMWFDALAGRPLMTLPHLILMDSPLQWIFNKGIDDQLGGQHLHGVISAAHSLVDAPAERIVQMAVEEVCKALPGIERDARVRLLHARVVKEKRATFSAVPGIDRVRPPARGAIPNLYLAGDWCRTGWPATMEGAARSGYLAAGGVMDDWNHLHQAFVPDLPIHPLYRFCGKGLLAKPDD